VHHHDAIGHRHRLDLVVRHVHRRRLQPLVQRLDLGAQFIGSPSMNVIEGTMRREGGASVIETADGVRWPAAGAPGGDGQAVVLGMRPEHLHVADGGVAAEVVVVEPTGAETEIVAQVGAAQVIFKTHGRDTLAPGQRIALTVEPAALHVFDKASGARIPA
jgi:multiple sugar transport system ATP-binding protein